MGGSSKSQGGLTRRTLPSQRPVAINHGIRSRLGEITPVCRPLRLRPALTSGWVVYSPLAKGRNRVWPHFMEAKTGNFTGFAATTGKSAVTCRLQRRQWRRGEGLIRFAQGLTPALLCRPYPCLECCAFILVSPKIHLLRKWRRGRDSNPRNLAVHALSKRAHSTTLPPLREVLVRPPCGDASVGRRGLRRGVPLRRSMAKIRMIGPKPAGLSGRTA